MVQVEIIVIVVIVLSFIIGALLAIISLQRDIIKKLKEK